MNSQAFLFIYFIIFIAFVLYFIFGRSKPKQPTQLDLRVTPTHDTDDTEAKSDADRVAEAKDAKSEDDLVTSLPAKEALKLIQGVAIYFVYNGHEWEAHEVLGLPKGSTLLVTTSHYQNLVKTADPSTFEFYEAAFSAILVTNSKAKR